MMVFNDRNAIKEVKPHPVFIMSRQLFNDTQAKNFEQNGLNT